MATARTAHKVVTTATGTTNSSSFDCNGATTLIVMCEDATNTAGNTTGVTYNGVAMTEMGRTAAPSQSRQITMWGLHNPASGANTLTATRTSSAVARFTVSAIGISGTDTSVAVTTNVQSISQTAATHTFNFTNTADDYVFCFGKFTSGGQAASTGSTLLSTYDIISDFESNPVPGGTNQSMTVTCTNAASCLLGAVIAQSSGGGSPTFVPRVSFIM